LDITEAFLNFSSSISILCDCLSLLTKNQQAMGSTEQLPKMQYRFLGRSGLQVSVISLGGWYDCLIGVT
jgi:hypothetical protein